MDAYLYRRDPQFYAWLHCQPLYVDQVLLEPPHSTVLSATLSVTVFQIDVGEQVSALSDDTIRSFLPPVLHGFDPARRVYVHPAALFFNSGWPEKRQRQVGVSPSAPK